MKKEYVTWVRFMGLPSKYEIDPTTNIENNWGHAIKFTETNYGNIPNVDRRFLGTIEYDETKISEDVLTRFCFENSVFGMTRITTEKALSLCNVWYEEGEVTLNKDGFTLDDNRIYED